MAASRTALAASQPEVLAASSELTALGNAVDVVVAAVYFAAAASPTVLLGPVQILLGGAGMGLLAVDGRLRQPGRGAQRPRGFVAGDPIPPAAHVAVPMLPAALSATLALAGGATLSRVMGPARAYAKTMAKVRGQALERIARRGPRAMADGPIAAELLAAAGRMAGGTLTEEDLSSALPVVVPCEIEGAKGRRVAVAPWRAELPLASSLHVVAAADARGRLAVACYEAPLHEDAVRVDDELYAPRGAAPVLRGQTRVPPADPRPTATPLALLELDGVLQVAAGGGGLGKLFERFSAGLPLEGEGRKLAVTGVLRTRDGGRAL